MDRRKRKSQDAIFFALLDLVEEKEFEKITINEIAELADVSRGTVYLNFENKYHLLEQCIQFYLGELFQVCTNVSETEPHYFEKIIKLMFQHLKENTRPYRLLFTNPTFDSFRNQFTQMLSYAFEDADKKNHSPASEVSIQFLSYGITGILVWWLKENQPSNIEVVTTDLQDLMDKSGLLVPFNH